MAQLNAFLIDLMRQRWAARQAGQAGEARDILDRILAALEVGDLIGVRVDQRGESRRHKEEQQRA